MVRLVTECPPRLLRGMRLEPLLRSGRSSKDRVLCRERRRAYESPFEGSYLRRQQRRLLRDGGRRIVAIRRFALRDASRAAPETCDRQRGDCDDALPAMAARTRASAPDRAARVSVGGRLGRTAIGNGRRCDTGIAFAGCRAAVGGWRSAAIDRIGGARRVGAGGEISRGSAGAGSAGDARVVRHVLVRTAGGGRACGVGTRRELACGSGGAWLARHAGVARDVFVGRARRCRARGVGVRRVVACGPCASRSAGHAGIVLDVFVHFALGGDAGRVTAGRAIAGVVSRAGRAGHAGVIGDMLVGGAGDDCAGRIDVRRRIACGPRGSWGTGHARMIGADTPRQCLTNISFATARGGIQNGHAASPPRSRCARGSLELHRGKCCSHFARSVASRVHVTESELALGISTPALDRAVIEASARVEHRRRDFERRSPGT